MKRILLALGLAATSSAALSAVEPPLWLRNQRISPDGKTIVFCYQGDLYSVSSNGGEAKRLTSHAAYDHSPVWSPDGKNIVFASDREGSDDLYIMSSSGGVARRLTFGSGSEVPTTYDHEGRILFATSSLPTRAFDQAPSPAMTQLYGISPAGGRPELVSALTMLQPSYNGRGDILYTDYKGYEDDFRKHHTSSIARDIWLKKAGGGFTKLTSFKGEDRNAVWDERGGFYYLSEQDGTFNLYHRSEAKAGAKDKQLTHYKGNPVRFLSRSNDGTLCYGYDGEIYTIKDGKKPQKLAVSIVSDVAPSDLNVRTLRAGAKAYAVSPSGDEFAVIVGGDVFVVNAEYGTTKRITNTPEEERDITFSADGRTLVYDSQRNGQWQLFKAEIVRKEDKKFAYAKEIKETQLTREKKACFQPVFNPKGDEIAFLRDRNEIAVISVKGGAIRTVVPSNVNFSYTDGDRHFEWSKNGKYILTEYQGKGGWAHTDCALYKADGSGMEINLTESGYNDTRGRFVLGDKALLFISDRAGYRSHGSWGATGDVYLMFLEDKAYQNFIMTKEDKALAKAEEAEKKKAEEESKKKSEKKDKDKDKKQDDKAKAKADSLAASKDKKAKEEAIEYNFDDRERRIIRITRTSGDINDAMINAEGTKLYFVARYESTSDLWEYDLETRASRIIAPGVGGSFTTSADGKKIYLQTGTQLREVNGKAYNFAVEQEHKPISERAHLFDHVQAHIRDKFYDVNLHGVDWAGYGKTYAKFLPHITHDRDFAELLSEMLGELNASHTGARALRRQPVAQPTGALAAFWDTSYRGDGLKIEEIIKGSPLLYGTQKLEPGMIIERINGELIKANEPIEKYLNGTIGKRTLLSVRGKDGKTFETYVKPTSLGGQQELLHERWLARREALVREWSEGRVGYVYVRNMNSPSFRTVFKDLLGKYRNCEAVVVDTRYNGGGWLHEDLAILLSGKKFSTFSSRGEYAGDDPFMQWTKPSCVLMNEGNYSNGHGFPYVYKTLGLGKLIGTPVAGTMTAVWWETLFSGTILYGIPQLMINDIKGKALENQELQPDIEVYNTPEDYLEGHDRQLKRAVMEMLK